MAQWRFLGPLWPMARRSFVGAGLCALSELSGRQLPPRPPAAPPAARLARRARARRPFGAAPPRRPRGETPAFLRPSSATRRSSSGSGSASWAGCRAGTGRAGGHRRGGPRAARRPGPRRRRARRLRAGRAGGNFPAMEDYLVGEGLPDVVDAHGPSGHVGSFGRLMRRRLPVNRWWGSLYDGLAPGHDPRCPGGAVGSVLAPDTAELRRQLERLIDTSDPGRAINILPLRPGAPPRGVRRAPLPSRPGPPRPRSAPSAPAGWSGRSASPPWRQSSPTRMPTFAAAPSSSVSHSPPPAPPPGGR